jgi:hypothetical protein
MEISVPSTSLPHPRDSIRNCALSMDQIPDLHSPLSPISESPSSPAYSTGKASKGAGAVGGGLCLGISITHGSNIAFLPLFWEQCPTGMSFKTSS